MTLVEDCLDKNLYLQYLHNYLHYIHKGESKHVHHLCVCLRCKLCDRYLLLRGALYLAQNRREIFHKVFQLVSKKALNSISYCYGINVLPLVWITWENSNTNIDTIEPLVIEELMQVVTVIV